MPAPNLILEQEQAACRERQQKRDTYGRYLPLSDSDKTDDLDDSEEGLTRQLKKLISQRKAPNVQLNAIKELMKRKYGKVTQKQADQIDMIYTRLSAYAT